MVTRRYARRRASAYIGAGVLVAAGAVVWAVLARDDSPSSSPTRPGSGSVVTIPTVPGTAGQTVVPTAPPGTNAAPDSTTERTDSTRATSGETTTTLATLTTTAATTPGTSGTSHTASTSAPLVTSLTIPVVANSSAASTEGSTTAGTQPGTAGTEPTANTSSAGSTPGSAPTADSFPAPKDVPALPDDGKTSAERTLTTAFVIKDDPGLAPKSVVTNGNGLFFAQNEAVGHDVTVYDRTGTEVGKISDTVDLAKFGINGGEVEGAPAEAAFSPDGKYLYVTNYQMTGPGYDPSATDDCDQGEWDDSFVYRIDVSTLTIDQVIPVGPVPEFVAVTPDGKRLITSNWCGFDISIIDTATGKELKRIPIGRHPRGLAVTADSKTAFVAVMGAHQIAEVDLLKMEQTDRFAGGVTPRHLVLSPDGKALYVSNNRDYVVRKFNTTTHREQDRVVTGKEPRTIALSPDGTVLYVVNFEDDTLTKVSTSNMTVIQQIPAGKNPIGVTYDPATRQVWVADKSGSLSVFVDK